VKYLLAALGLAILTAPIAAVFLFSHEGRPRHVPPGDKSGPVVYPGDELQQEEANQP
jgi:hypothetical protein